MDNDFKVDFIGIGAARSGTTWLASVLQEHPEICMSRPKELDFFSRRTLYLPTSNIEMGDSWYRSKFSHYLSDQIRGEFSPSYFVDKDAPRLIREKFPDVKLILSIRDPVDALISHYQNIKIYHPMNWSFEEFLQHRPDFLEYYQYDKHLENYLEYFEKNKIHIIPYEQVLGDPVGTVTDVLKYIGVDSSIITDQVFKRVNQSGKSRSRIFRNFLSRTKNLLDKNCLIRKIYKAARLDDLGWKLVRLNCEPADKVIINESTKKDLEAYFAASKGKLQDMIVHL